VDPATGAPQAVAYALYHPAAAFRQAQLRETLFEDMAALPELLLDARQRREAVRTEAHAIPVMEPAVERATEADEEAYAGVLALGRQPVEDTFSDEGDSDQMSLF
ncbi:MAG: hypothetical protein ACXVAE_06685, partial [Candidatus Limnocylindrales bacterium]